MTNETKVTDIRKQVSIRPTERDKLNIHHIQEILGEKTANKAILRALEEYIALKERVYWQEVMLVEAQKKIKELRRAH